MQIAIAQLNPTVGDIFGNAEKILLFYKKVAAKNAELVVFPELALIGYSPEDLVLSPAFCKDAMTALKALAKATAKGPAMIVGSLWTEKGKIYNAGIFMDRGKIAFVQRKMALPNYDVFDEKRVFSAAEKQAVFSWRGTKIGLLICEDIWRDYTSKNLKKQGAKLLISINASPFETGKLALRKKVVSKVAKDTKLPVVYVNILGGQDDIVFDGGSFIVNEKGKVTAQFPEFEEGVFAVPMVAAAREESWRLWSAMKLGLSDYLHKNGFTDVVIGLSGGIDSALTAALAVDALGAKHVHGVLLPSPYTSHESVEDALALAGNLGIDTVTVPITEAMQVFEERLNPIFHESGWMENIAVGGNLQARLRGITLMALSNKNGWMLLSTGNKSEIAVGYSTLYGDSCGAYNVIKDLYKTQVYALAKWRNGQGAVIPKRSITKAPSAELKPGQKDQDQLPPYDVLDAILELHIEHRLSAAEIAAKGHSKSIAERVIEMVRLSEYKRRQSAPGVKLSPMNFWKERRFPLTNAYPIRS